MEQQVDVDEATDEALTLAERDGRENLRERLATGDVLMSHANGLLNLLLAGIGGALAIGRTVFDAAPAEAHVWGAAAVALYWMLVAGVLLSRCIMTRETQMLHNEPNNLYRPEVGWTYLQLRRAELRLLQDRINITKRRNAPVAWWLDACRMAAVAAPLVFAIVALAVAACR